MPTDQRTSEHTNFDGLKVSEQSVIASFLRIKQFLFKKFFLKEKKISDIYSKYAKLLF